MPRVARSSRLSVLLLAVGCAALARGLRLVRRRGADDGAAGATPAQPTAAKRENFPAASEPHAAGHHGNLPEGPVLAPSVSLLEPGANRIGFALFAPRGKQLAGAGVALYVGADRRLPARGPFVARSESLKVAPQFQSKQTATDPDSAPSGLRRRRAVQAQRQVRGAGDRPARRPPGRDEPDRRSRSAARRACRPTSATRRR